MKSRSILVLLVTLTVLSLGYWWMLDSEQNERVRVEEAKRLFSFAPADIAQMTVTSEDGRTTVGKRREDGTWVITNPFEIEAYSLLWERMADQFANLSQERMLTEAPDDLVQYQLDDPRVVVEATTQDGQPVKVAFGTTDPTESGRYAQINDKAVVLLSPVAYFELNRGRDMLRQFYAFSLEADEKIQQVEFTRYSTGGGPNEAETSSQSGEQLASVRFALEPSGEWRMTSPATGPADQEQVNGLVNQFQFAAATGFNDEPEDLAGYGLEHPGARLQFWTDPQGEPQTLWLGAVEPPSGEEGDIGRLFAKRENAPTVFKLDANLLNALPPTPDSFRAKALLTNNPQQITTFQFANGSELITLEHAPEKAWKIVAPDSMKIDQIFVSNYIGALSRTLGTEFVARGEGDFGFDDPFLAIEYTLEGKNEPYRIVIGGAAPSENEMAYLYARQDTGFVTKLREDAAQSLRATAFDFQTKDLFSFDAANARELRFTLDGTDYVLQQTSRRWIVQEPAGGQFESASDLEALLATLNPVKANQLVQHAQPEDLTPYGLAEPVLSVTATVETDGQTSTVGPLRIGAPTPESSRNRYAVLEGRDGVFTVLQSNLDDLRAALEGLRTP